MTTYEKLKSMLTERGMSDLQADIVMQNVKFKLTAGLGAYNITWDLPAEGYPDILYNLWGRTVIEYGLNWLNEHCPEAWFKPMFFSPADQAKFMASIADSPTTD